ncbi:MAG: hypothetical protein N3D10_02550 [Candidatus Micrarchaeota archaeon]|nr:hypothetical protein [Candidatus Micrarchaeota archaeon]
MAKRKINQTINESQASGCGLINQNVFKKNFEPLVSSFSSTEAEQTFLAQAKEKILQVGNKIFEKDPQLCDKIVELGYKSAPMLLELMKITDKKIKLHIPCTAAALGIKIVKNKDEKAIEFFTQEFGKPNLVYDYVFDVLKDCTEEVVFKKMRELFDKYSSIDFSQASFYELSYLRYSTIYLARNGTIEDAINISKLLNSSSNQVRVIAGTNLINFSLREDISKEDKLKLAQTIFSSISKDSNFYAAKLEILEKGNFEEVLDFAFSDPQYFSPANLGKAIYYSILERFFNKSDSLKSKVLELFTRSPNLDHSLFSERLRVGLNILFNNIKKGRVLSPEWYKKYFDSLAYLTEDESISLDIKKKIALVFSFFPPYIIQPWLSTIYLKSEREPTNELCLYVYDLLNRPEKERKSQIKFRLLVVDADQTFSSIFSSKLLHYLSYKELQDVELMKVDSFLEASYLFGNYKDIKICFLSEKVLVSESLLKDKNRSFLTVLDSANKLLNPPRFVLLYTTLSSKELESIKNLYPNLNIMFYPKQRVLAEAINLFKSLEISKYLKEEEILISPNIFDHLQDKKIVDIIKAHYGEFVEPSEKEPFGKNVLIIERGNQAHIQLKKEESIPRIRFVLLLPSSQSALLDKSGIKKAYVEHLGGFNLGSRRISPAFNSLMVYYDKGGKTPTGVIEPMVWKYKNKVLYSLSKGDRVPFIFPNGKGAFSCFVNKSGRPILLKLTEYLE